MGYGMNNPATLASANGDGAEGQDLSPQSVAEPGLETSDLGSPRLLRSAPQAGRGPDAKVRAARHEEGQPAAPDFATDCACMAGVAGGDDAAYRTLVERHLRRIHAFAARTLGDVSEAEDVAQETCERMWAHASRWQSGKGQLSTWLHRVALNLCLDRLRKRREEPADNIEVEDPAPAAADILEQQEIATHVRRALNRLTDQQRAAIALCYYQGLQNSQAAEVMELSVEAVESLLARGRRSMRTQLQEIAPQLLPPS